MKFCTRCGSRIVDQGVCKDCGASRVAALDRNRSPERAPAGDPPTFVFSYTNRSLLGLIEHQRQVRIPFSYINGTVLEVQTHEDETRRVDMRVWLRQDDPTTGPCGPIVRQESQPSIRNVVRLRLGSGAERSFALTQVRFRAPAGSRITLIFPVQTERAMNPIYDCAALGAVDHTANYLGWSTTHPEIHALRERLSEEQAEVFADSLGSFLDGLCRRCLRLFVRYRGERRRSRVYSERSGLMR